MAHYDSHHGTVSRRPEELYMDFVDMRNFTRMLPDQYKDAVQADFDSLKATARGFSIGVRVNERHPYDLIRLYDDGAPFNFCISLHFNPVEGDGSKTDFSIELDADLNLMMKTMLGSKLQDAIDKVVDSLVDVSEGRTPEGLPSDFKL